MKRHHGSVMKEIRASYDAMMKFSRMEALSVREWAALSWLTMLNKEHPVFGPSNIRWATSEEERLENLIFYKKWMLEHGGPDTPLVTLH